MAEPVSPQPGSRPHAHVNRFVGAFAILVVILAAAGVGTWLLTRVDRPEPFSSFEPKEKDDPVRRAQEVADFVSARYTDVPEGTPLVRVEAGEDDKTALPVNPQIIAIGSQPPGINSYEPDGNILFFRMCRTPDTCALQTGDDNQLLGPLLGRQAHELALYGFSNVKESDYVIVILPNGFTSQPDPANPVRAVHFFRRTDLEDELERPISDTLPDPVPTTATLNEATAGAIEERVARTRYQLTSTVDAANTYNVFTLTPLF